MSKEQITSCNQTGGCINLQVMKRDIEYLSTMLKDSMMEAKECINRSNNAQRDLAKSVSEAKVLINIQAQMLKDGDVKFSKINHDFDAVENKVHHIDTRVSIIESGGRPPNSNIAKWGIGGGVGSLLAWAIGKFYSGS